MRTLLDSVSAVRAHIQSVHVEAFASVEGTLEINDGLHRARAQVVVDSLQAQLQAPVSCAIQTAENWVMFRQQFGRLPRYRFLLDMPKDSVKAYLRQHETDPEIEGLLAQQRYTRVQVVVDKPVPEGDYPAMALGRLEDAYSALRYGRVSNRDSVRAALLGLQSYLFGCYENGWLPAEQMRRAWVEPMPDMDSLAVNQQLFVQRHPELLAIAGIDGWDALFRRFPNSAIVAYNATVALLVRTAASAKGLTGADAEKLIARATSMRSEALASRWDTAIAHGYYWSSMSMKSQHYRDMEKVHTALAGLTSFYMSRDMTPAFSDTLVDHLVLYRDFADVSRVFETYLDRAGPDPELYMDYLKLNYVHPDEDASGAYALELMDALESLGRERWCMLFEEEGCSISFQVLDYEPVRNMYCDVCTAAGE
jgi:hypothetical protein